MNNDRYFNKLYERLKKPMGLIQVLLGPRQVGKTTLVRQLEPTLGQSLIYNSADSPIPHGPEWIAEKWSLARAKLGETRTTQVLVFDEIQKIRGWSEVVKKEFDDDKFKQRKIVPILLGSSATLIQKGLTESLAGRFEQMLIPHWSFKEVHETFGLSLEQYIYFGAYPGAMGLIEDEGRWKSYIRDSIIETTISRDLLLTTRVEKPILLRNLFQIGMNHSSEVVSYQKMLGQLQDVGNATTLAHYLSLLSQIMTLGGLEKYSGNEIRQKRSSPKLIAFNMALKSALSESSFSDVRNSPVEWGRWVESAVGAELINRSMVEGFELFYWSEAHAEVDFVLKRGPNILALEIKTGRRREKLNSLGEFKRQNPSAKILLVGVGGIPLEDFFRMGTDQLFSL